MTYLILILATSCNAAASLLLKLLAKTNSDLISIATLKNPLFYFALLAFGSSFIGYALFLRRIDLAVGYPVFVGTTFVLVLLLSYFILRETLAVQQIIGITLIFTGLLLAIK